MSQQGEKIALEDYFSARTVIIWHLAAMILSTLLMLTIFIIYFITHCLPHNDFFMTLSKNVIRNISWPIVIIIIFYFGLLLASLKSIEDQRTILNVEAFFGLMFWIAWLMIALGFFYESSNLSIWISYEMLEQIPFMLYWTLFSWLPYMGVSGIVLKEEHALEIFKLRMIERKILKLEKVCRKHEQFLVARNKLKEEINKIIAVDVANLGVKSNIFHEQAKSLPDDNVQERISQIEKEIKEVASLEVETEERLNALKTEMRLSATEFEEVTEKLHKLEILDPANIKIKILKLRNDWKSLNEKELEKIRTTGELEQSYKEQLLIKFQIEKLDGKIKDKNKELASVKLAENALMLEKLVLQLETLDRDIKRKEPRLLQINDELEELEIKRNKIKQSLPHN